MKKVGKLYPLELPEGPWQEISINIIGPLPRLNEKYAIVVIVDWFTKMIWLKAMIITVSSEEIARIYRDEIWKLHRILHKVLSDRGPQFALNFIRDLIKSLRIKISLSTAYHSQIDGQMEQINQNFEAFL